MISMGSFRTLVDETEEHHLKHQKQEDLSGSNHSIHHIRLFLQSLKILHKVEHQKGDRIDHAVNHQQPMKPPGRYDAKQEDEDETSKRIAVDADELTNR